MPYLKADKRHPFMGLDNKICKNPAYWCRLHQVWLSENDVKRRQCKNKKTFDMIGTYRCGCLEKGIGEFCMSMISELIKNLRALADFHNVNANLSYAERKLVNEAADTIEAISAKLSVANMERSEGYYGELGIIKVNSDVKKELIEQHNKAFELINTIPLEGNEVWHGYAGGIMQTLGALIDNIEYSKG